MVSAGALWAARPVELIDFEAGDIPKQRRNRETDQTQIVGVTIWYRCAEIRPLFAIGRRALHEAP